MRHNQEETTSTADSSQTCVCNTKCNTSYQNYNNRQRQPTCPYTDSATSEDSITRRCHYEQYLAFISTANSLKDLCKLEKAKMLNRLCAEVHKINSRVLSSRTESYRDYGRSSQGRSRGVMDREEKERCKDYVRKKICKADKIKKLPGHIIDDDRYLKHLQRHPIDKDTKHKRKYSIDHTDIRETSERNLKPEKDSRQIEQGSTEIDQGPLKENDVPNIKDIKEGSLKETPSISQLEHESNRRESVSIKEVISTTSVKKERSKTNEGTSFEEKIHIPEIKISKLEDLSQKMETSKIELNGLERFSGAVELPLVQEEVPAIKIEYPSETEKLPSVNLESLRKAEISPSKLIGIPENFKLETLSQSIIPMSVPQTGHSEKRSKDSTMDENLIETIEDEKSFKKYPSSKELLKENEQKEPEIRKLKKCEPKDKGQGAPSSKRKPPFSMEAAPRFNCTFRDPPKCCTFQQIICYPHSEPVILNDVFKNSEGLKQHIDKSKEWSKQNDQTSNSDFDNSEEDEQINESDECVSGETKPSYKNVEGTSEEKTLSGQRYMGEEKLSDQGRQGSSEEENLSVKKIKERRSGEGNESVQLIKERTSEEFKLFQNIEESDSADAKLNDHKVGSIAKYNNMSNQNMKEISKETSSRVLENDKKNDNYYLTEDLQSKHEPNNSKEDVCETFESENSFDQCKSAVECKRNISLYGILRRMKAIISLKFCDFSRKMFCSSTKPCEPTNKKFQTDVIEIAYCVALGRRCLLVHWQIIECKKMYGYEISVNGCLVRRINTPNCVSDVICGYDTSRRHLICVAPIIKKCEKKKNSFHSTYQMVYGNELGPPSYYAYEPYIC